MEITLKNKMKMKNQRNLSMKPGAKRACWLCRGALFAGLFFWMGLGGTQGQTPGLTYPVPLDEEHFPNGSFREEVSVYDADGDGSLSVEECGTVKEIAISNDDVSSLEGIRYFYALESLYCHSEELRTLDVSGLINLEKLDCYHGSNLRRLDVSGCTALKRLNCSANQLDILDMSGCTALKHLNCSANQLASLELGGLAVLDSLDCSSNYLMSLDLRSLSSLTNLDCRNNYLTSLDLSEQTALVTLNCDNNQLTSLDLSEQTALAYLRCDNNQLTKLDVGSMYLESVLCFNNQLASLDLSGRTLEYLDCSNNQLLVLDVSQCESQYTYDFFDQIFIVKDTNRICLPDLIRSHGGDMGKVHDIVVNDDCIYKDSIVQFLRPGAKLRYVYETGRGSMESRLYFFVDLDSDSAVVIIDEDHFPDFNFRRYVQENHDANQNGILETTESYCVDNVSQQVDEMGLVRYPSDYSEMFGVCLVWMFRAGGLPI